MRFSSLLLVTDHPVLAWNSPMQSLTPTVNVVPTFLILVSPVGRALAALVLNLEFVANRL